MHFAIKIADQFDVDLGVEPELANVVSSATKAKRLIEECNSPRIKIILDAANLFEVATINEQREIVSEAIELLAPNIAMAHAKDRNASGGFVAAGNGVLDYPHFLRCLKKVGFDGPLVTHGLSANEAREVANFLNNISSLPLREGQGVGASQK
jgi:sugar phosphate isomerase/epimerase